MITVAEAWKLIQQSQHDFGVETVPLLQSTGRILRETWVADRDFPPFHRVAMDGIAIDFVAWEKGRREFAVAGVAPAGAPQQALADVNSCLEVMTGAMLPTGCDTVIPYELVSIADGKAAVNLESLKQGQNIHRQGHDRSRGAALVAPGKVIAAPEIGVGATIGQHEVQVARLPKVLVVSSGNELVEVEQTPLPHQIRKSNVHTLAAEVERLGLPVARLHLPDDYAGIEQKLRQQIAENDVLLLSGGVSKGKFDFLPKALSAIGVEQHFHRVRQRPGKPFWFGTHPAGCTVFAFPGNPVSSFLCFHHYFVPWLRLCLGQVAPQNSKAVLAEEVNFKPDLTLFLTVRLRYSDQGQLMAHPVRGNGSGDLANLTEADGYVVIPQGKEVFAQGEVLELVRFR
ncbi:MAG: molybdopterin molybdotransferase MoeA [Salibacteraceae bacterium]